MNALPDFACDAMMPGLANAMNPVAAARAFSMLFEHRAHDLQCKIERVRHKRGQKTIIAYRLQGTDVAGAPFIQHAMARVFPRNVLADRLRKAQAMSLSPCRLGPSVALLPDLQAIVWLFPNDRKITALAELVTDPITSSPAFAWLSRAAKIDDDASIRVLSVDVVRYVPEQGCTVRWRLDDGIATHTIFAKCRSDARGARSFSVQQALSATGKVRVPTALAFDAARNIFWQREMKGVSLDADTVLADLDAWLPRIVKTLLQLQMSRIDDLPTEDIIALQASALRVWPEIAAALPRHRDEIDRSYAALSRALTMLPACTDVLQHGDLHPSNLFWDEHRLGLLDFDTAKRGFSTRDFASLSAALLDRMLARSDHEDACGAVIQRLRMAAVAFPDDETAFDCLFAHSLLSERLYRTVTRLKSTPNKPQRLLELAKRALAPYAPEVAING